MSGSNSWEQRLLQVDFEKIDYDGAQFWSPARNYLVPRTQRDISYVIIHITGGPALNERNALNTFRAGPASAHYIVNRDGRVVQMVREAHIANHVDNINSRTNRESIGIEHVNPWNDSAQMHPTSAQYEASARLVRYLCSKYNIPIQHNTTRHGPGIRGHIEEQPNSGHVSCPNPAWDWGSYIPLVQTVNAETFEEIIDGLVRPDAGGSSELRRNAMDAHQSRQTFGGARTQSSGTIGGSTSRGPTGMG